MELGIDQGVLRTNIARHGSVAGPSPGQGTQQMGTALTRGFLGGCLVVEHRLSLDRSGGAVPAQLDEPRHGGRVIWRFRRPRVMFAWESRSRPSHLTPKIRSHTKFSSKHVVLHNVPGSKTCRCEGSPAGCVTPLRRGLAPPCEGPMSDATETEAGRPPGRGVPQHVPEAATVVRAVTAIMGTVVGLTFLFGVGNVLNLALRLGVPAWAAPLVVPAVDLSILGLLLGTRHLVLTGASPDMLRPARRLLIFASVVTLCAERGRASRRGRVRKAAFDAVGPLLLIGWSEVGPGLLQAISTTSLVPDAHDADRPGRMSLRSRTTGTCSGTVRGERPSTESPTVSAPL